MCACAMHLSLLHAYVVLDIISCLGINISTLPSLVLDKLFWKIDKNSKTKCCLRVLDGTPQKWPCYRGISDTHRTQDTHCGIGRNQPPRRTAASCTPKYVIFLLQFWFPEKVLFENIYDLVHIKFSATEIQHLKAIQAALSPLHHLTKVICSNNADLLMADVAFKTVLNHLKRNHRCMTWLCRLFSLC